jgi:hypothetical protein
MIEEVKDPNQQYRTSAEEV